ncbi:hypothetical protein C8R43DRAFT_1033857 [Mycena crocata]|nr:hypothetical protein C8R43DRAFT_1033857 [Mycena crocata]
MPKFYPTKRNVTRVAIPSASFFCLVLFLSDLVQSCTLTTMSCSICLLPFIPDLNRATSPLPQHSPPKSIVPKDQAAYFLSGVGIGTKTLGCVQRFRYYSCNMFGSVTGFEVTTWEFDGNSTLFMAHHVCLALLRHTLKVEDESLSSITALCAHELILGRPQGGAIAGRFKNINYEHVGENVDLSPFWQRGRDLGCNVFNWEKLNKDGQLNWLIQRPDIFPRFSRVVSPEKLATLAFESERTDLITTMPLELVLHLLPYLSLRSYVALVATCRFLRYHALTTFQSHARSLVLQLPWALPTRCELEKIKPQFRTGMAGEGDELRSGDWFLYLNHIHWTKSMRVRRWIWALCEEFLRVWTAKLPASEYIDLSDGIKSPARIQLEKKIQASIKEAENLRALNEGARAAKK